MYYTGMKSFKKYKNPLVFAIIILLTINIFFYNYKITWNYGKSMEPTFNHGDFMVVERKRSLGEKWKPERYDHVIISTSMWENLSKRVIALQGERVRIKSGKIYINDKLHTDPYGRGDVIYYTEDEEDRLDKPKKDWLFLNTNQDVGIIPKGYVWVIGDNRNITWFGKVKVEDIKGLVIL